jgi:hypothetical protein
LHGARDGKYEIRFFDYVDANVRALQRMVGKRLEKSATADTARTIKLPFQLVAGVRKRTYLRWVRLV